MDFSVERAQRSIDIHGTFQHALERATGTSALEARQPPARVHAAPGLLRTGRQRTAALDEAQ
jgi:hypothetical protein